MCTLCLSRNSYLVADSTSLFLFFFFNDTATTEIYTLSLHDALPISSCGRSPERRRCPRSRRRAPAWIRSDFRSEEHTSELQSQSNLVCRLLLEKKKKKTYPIAAPGRSDNEATDVHKLSVRSVHRRPR